MQHAPTGLMGPMGQLKKLIGTAGVAWAAAARTAARRKLMSFIVFNLK